MRYLALSVGVLALAASYSPSQWGNRGCPPVGGFAVSPYAQVPAASSRSWGTHPADPGRWQLWVNGRQAGGYCALEGIYRDYDGATWSEPKTPPNDVPAEAIQATKVRWQALPNAKKPAKPAKKSCRGCSCTAQCNCETCSCKNDGPCAKGCDCFAAAALGCTCPAGRCACTWERDCGNDCFCAAKVADAGPDDPVRNFGLDLRGMREDNSEHYHINGRYVTRDQVYEALVTGTLSDDRAKRRLTIIGSDVDCKRALGTLPADLSAKYLVQCLRPDNFLVSRTGFKTDGTPSIYLQSPPDPKTGFGEVLWREDSLTQATWENVRKSDPDYKPDADPNPNKPKPAPSPPALPQPAVSPSAPRDVPWWLWAGGGLAALLVLTRTQPR